MLNAASSMPNAIPKTEQHIVHMIFTMSTELILLHVNKNFSKEEFNVQTR